MSRRGSERVAERPLVSSRNSVRAVPSVLLSACCSVRAGQRTSLNARRSARVADCRRDKAPASCEGCLGPPRAKGWM